MCESNSLIRQNQELRDRLNEDAALYRRRIDTYRQAQQNQAALVARLQSKVLQYRRKYSDLEERMCEPPDTPDHARPIKVLFGQLCAPTNQQLGRVESTGLRRAQVRFPFFVAL